MNSKKMDTVAATVLHACSTYCDNADWFSGHVVGSVHEEREDENVKLIAGERDKR